MSSHMGVSFVSLMWRLQSSFRFPCVASQGSSQVSWKDNTKTSDAAKMDGPFLGKSLPRKMYENLSEQAGSFIPFCCWGEGWILIVCSEDMNTCRWLKYEYVWVLIRWFLIALVTLFCCGTVFWLSAFQFGRRTYTKLNQLRFTASDDRASHFAQILIGRNKHPHIQITVDSTLHCLSVARCNGTPTILVISKANPVCRRVMKLLGNENCLYDKHFCFLLQNS